LRRAARRRLASAFGLPVGTDPAAVVATVAARTPLARDRLEAVLLDAPVADDTALAALARDLDDVVVLALGSAGPRPTPAPASPSAPSPAELPGGRS
jgi:hypothetical protein